MNRTRQSTWLLNVFQALGLMLVFLSAKGGAQSTEDSARLYAAYTYNLMSFTQWPVKVGNNLTLCVAGQNRDTQLLSLLHGKTVQGSTVEVVNYQTMMPLERCQVLFVASAEYADLFDRAMNLQLLLLTNIMPDNGRSSMILLANDAGRVVFDVNLAMLKRAGLQLPPSLLKLARRVMT